MMMTPPPQKIWLVGDRGVGKKSLAVALGATLATAPSTDANPTAVVYDWCPAPTIAPVQVVVVCDEDATSSAQITANDIVLVVFDLTNKTSFTSASDKWTARLLQPQRRAVLVGAKLDRSSERQVATADAMEVALVEFDEYVEVSAACPPFGGVMYMRQLLATWIAQDQDQDQQPQSTTKTTPTSGPVAAAQEPSSVPSTRAKGKTKGCIRTSVWLYDPTEEIHVPMGCGDVTIRPIARALFEMREAGSDRIKSQERRRDQCVAKVVARSRYHGPTESSRSMRWQAHQQQQWQEQQIKMQRRQTTSDLHAALSTKSFMQTTKLMKQRVADTICHDQNNHHQATRPRAKTTTAANAPPSKMRPMAPSLSVSPCKLKLNPVASRRRGASFTLLDRHHDDGSDHHFTVSSVVSSSSSPSSSSPLRPTTHGLLANKKQQNEIVEIQPTTPDVLSPLEKGEPVEVDSPSPFEELLLASQPEESDLHDDGEDHGFSSDIDDMLDYFDGVALPI